MFSVIASGFKPAALAAYPAAADVAVLPSPLAADFVQAGLDLLTAGDPVPRVLIYPRGRESARRVGMLRAAARDSGLRTLALGRPTTGLAATATVLAGVGTHDIRPGVAASYLLERLATLLPTYAVTTSVASADLPMVGLRHHIVSWIPGTHFSIALDDQPRLSTGSLPAPAARQGEFDVVAAGQPRLAPRLAGLLPDGVVETFELPPDEEDSFHWWGNARFYEVTLVPRELTEISAQLATAATSRCSQCGEPVTGACPFCVPRGSVPA